MITVPSSLAEAVAVELLQPFELPVKEVADACKAFLLGLGGRQVAHVDDVVAHAWHEFDAFVGHDVDLYNLVFPELALHQHLHEWCDVDLCELLCDIARCDDEVAGVLRAGHDASLVVDVVVVAGDALDADDGQSLRDADADVSVLCLVAFGGADERTLFQYLLNVAWVDSGHSFFQRVELLPFEDALDFRRAEEAVGVLVGDVDGHFCAHLLCLVRFVERGHGQHQVGCKQDVEQGDGCFLPVDVQFHHVCFLL